MECNNGNDNAARDSEEDDWPILRLKEHRREKKREEKRKDKR